MHGGLARTVGNGVMKMDKAKDSMKISERDKERDCIKYVLMWLWVVLPVSHVQILMNTKRKGKEGLG